MYTTPEMLNNEKEHVDDWDYLALLHCLHNWYLISTYNVP
jgi:hypothetical protein